MWLELGDFQKAMERVDDDEKDRISIPTPGGWQDAWCHNEAGLYSLIFGSRKPEAKAFKRWITHEVLPALRKTGRYELNQTPLIENTRRETQVEHSKQVAILRHAKGGKEEIISQSDPTFAPCLLIAMCAVVREAAHPSTYSRLKRAAWPRCDSRSRR